MPRLVPNRAASQGASDQSKKEFLDRVKSAIEGKDPSKIPDPPKSMIPSALKWNEPFRKEAAADLGRRVAHSYVSTELAKSAGQILASRVEDDQEMEKAASLMVRTGALSMEEYLLEKEAGWTGLRNMFSRARSGLSGIRSRVGGLFRKKQSYNPKKAAEGWSTNPKKQVPEFLGGPKKKDPKKGFGWGKAALGVGAAGAIYGGAKLIPAAARAMESTSTTPMAHGLGWSPVSYGYGYNPYGSGMATMGGGA